MDAINNAFHGGVTDFSDAQISVLAVSNNSAFGARAGQPPTPCLKTCQPALNQFGIRVAD